MILKENNIGTDKRLNSVPCCKVSVYEASCDNTVIEPETSSAMRIYYIYDLNLGHD